MKNLTPSKLRLILGAILLALTLVGMGIFMFGYSKINEYAVDAQDIASKASSSNNSLQELITTKRTLAQDSATVDRVAKLASESKLYVYQDQIIKDINQFAGEARLSISNITFTDASTASVSTAATGQTAAPTGVKSVTATITLKNPIEYIQILTFLHLVEQSLFRMQVSQISLSHSQGSDTSNNQVSSDVLTIEVYVR